MTAKQTPRHGTGGQQTSAGSGTSGTTLLRTGCPCGCRTRLPWLDDESCIRHRPLPPARDWPGYTVADLGLVPHPRETCQACQAAGK